MKTRIVNSKELSTKSLKAETYILKPYKITYLEEVTHTVDVYLDAVSKKEAESILRKMTVDELSKFLDKQKQRTKTLTSRDLLEVEEIKREM